MKLRAACLSIALSLGCVHFAHAAPPPLTPDGQPKELPQPPPDPAAKDKSRAAFRKGVAQIKANDWAGARQSFEDAYTLVQHPSILLNLGISRLKTGDPVLAEEALTKFLQEDTGAEPNELASARDALAEAKKQIGTVKITATPPNASVKVDGKDVSLKNDGTASVRVKPGSHTVNAEADGYTPLEKSADVTAKAEVPLEITLVAKDGVKPPPPPSTTEKPAEEDGPSGRKIGGYVLGGVAVVGLGVMAIEGIHALGLSSDYSDKTNPLTYGNADTKSSGITARTVADVGLVVALLAGTGAVILLFTDIGKDAPADTTKPAPTPTTSWKTPGVFRF